MSNGIQPSINDAQLGLFARGVIALLSAWPALRIAIAEYQPYANDDETGSQKRIRLAEEIVDAFYTASAPTGPPTDRLEDFLLEFVETELEIGLEDDSQAAVTRDLKTLWSAVVTGPSAQPERIVAEFESMAARASGSITRQNDAESESGDDSGSEDDEDEGMDVDAPAPSRPKPVIDEDGFELVQSRKPRR